MVDFKSRLNNPKPESHIDPIQLYETLDRASDKGPLRDAQKSVLEQWYKSHLANKDVIIKLHTGQGKTLIGLLILQSLINQKKGPALYLCPDNLLINQTREQARLFGIQVCDSADDIPDQFISGEKILITSVQKLFNGLTKFGIGARHQKVASILMDDAHACADNIRKACSITIPKDEPAFTELLSLFTFHLEQQGEGTFADIQNGRFGSYLPVPYWAWIDNKSEVAKILSRHQDKKSIKFTWPLLKDQLENCQCVVSGDSIEIEPILAPLDLFGSYWKASNRIFMSATVTDDAFLVKGLRLTSNTIQNPVTFSEEKWSGEKMVLIPSLIDESLDRGEVVKYFAQDWPQTRFGRVALVSSFAHSRDWEAYGSLVAKSDTIRDLLSNLKKGSYDKALVLANRYDGIDLPDESCRILIFDGKPYSQSLIDTYEESCRPDSEATLMKTVRTIEQGLGRCVRGEKDYAAAVLIGPELVKTVRDKNSRDHLSSQVSMQLQIGFDLAEMGREESSSKDPKAIFIELLNQSLRRDPDWKTYYSQQMNNIREKGASKNLLKSYEVELQAELLHKGSKYVEATQLIQKLMDESNFDTEDKGWYLQTMARFNYKFNRDQSDAYQVAAHRANQVLLAPRIGVTVSKLKITSKGRIDRIRNWLSTIGSYSQLNLHITEVLDNLSFGKPAEKFEDALNKLSFALGFKGERPDKMWKEGPDNLWAINDNTYILWECKSDALPTKKAIDKREADQMNRSYSWFTKHYQGCSSTNIIVHPSHKVESAGAFRQEVLALRQHNLTRLKKELTNFYKSFESSDFSDLSSESIEKSLASFELEASSIVGKYMEEIKNLKE